MNTEQPLTKKERREKRQEGRLELQKSQQKKATHQRVTKWVIIILVIGLVTYGFFLLITQTTEPRPGKSIAIQRQQHIPTGSERPEYNSNPPTSGSHYAQPTDWGVYQKELKDENVIHSLEHGGIWISYQPSINEDIKEKLEAIGKKYSGSVVVSPRNENDALIALASWGRLEKLTSFDEYRIIEFIKRNKNKSPEPLAR